MNIEYKQLNFKTMTYKSDAQRRKFHAMLNRGEIARKTVAEWDRESKGMRLPERVHPKKKGK